MAGKLRICSAMLVAMRWQTPATIRDPCKRISGTAIFSTPSVTPSYRRQGSRIFGGDALGRRRAPQSPPASPSIPTTRPEMVGRLSRGPQVTTGLGLRRGAMGAPEISTRRLQFLLVKVRFYSIRGQKLFSTPFSADLLRPDAGRSHESLRAPAPGCADQEGTGYDRRQGDSRVLPRRPRESVAAGGAAAADRPPARRSPTGVPWAPAGGAAVYGGASAGRSLGWG
jgi:hypothetical protein